MLQKITKKSAIELLESKQNLLIGNFRKPLKEVESLIIEGYDRIHEYFINNEKNVFYRKCIYKQSNALQFNDKSYLYFNGFKCYAFKEWLIFTNDDITLVYTLK